MQVFCDFDGTISIEDATDMVLSRFAGSEWEDIERQWKQGFIGSGECMRRQIALSEASRKAISTPSSTRCPSTQALRSFCPTAVSVIYP